MSDIRVEVKFKNKRLYDAIQQETGGSVPAFCKRIGLSYASVLHLLHCRISIVNLNNEPRLAVKRIAEFLGYNWEELFPQRLYPEAGIRRTSRPLSFLVSFAQLEAATTLEKLLPKSGNPEEAVFQSELEAAVRRSLDTLSKRQASVMALRFGLLEEEKPLQEVGKLMRISPERVRQIQARALRLLRHPGRSRQLRPFHFPDETTP